MKHRSDRLQDLMHLAADAADVQLSELSGSDPSWWQLLALLAERKEDATADAELLRAEAAVAQLLCLPAVLKIL